MLTFGELFLSFRGRINRSMFWIGILAVIGAGYAGTLLFQLIFNRVTSQYPVDAALQKQVLDIAPLVGFGLAAFAAWVLLVKRLHDRGKSAWVLLIFAGLALCALSWSGIYPIIWLPNPDIPLAAVRGLGIAGALGLAWFFIEVLLVPSKAGANRYGPDPFDVSS